MKRSLVSVSGKRLWASILTGVIVLILSGCGSRSGSADQNLGPLLRAGNPDFDKYVKQITIDEKDAFESPRAVGDIIMDLRATVRNFTGRTLNGLEIRGVVVDLEDKPIKERTITPIPGQRAELENNQRISVSIKIEGFSKNDTRANYRIEVTGIRFKP